MPPKSINWTTIQERWVLPAKASVLVILDCCNAAGAAINTSLGRPDNGPKELLGACPVYEQTLATWYSFRVADVLRKAAWTEEYLTTGDLQNGLEELWRTDKLRVVPISSRLSEHEWAQIRLVPQPHASAAPSMDRWPPWDEVYERCRPKYPDFPLTMDQSCSSDGSWGQPACLSTRDEQRVPEEPWGQWSSAPSSTTGSWSSADTLLTEESLPNEEARTKKEELLMIEW